MMASQLTSQVSSRQTQFNLPRGRLQSQYGNVCVASEGRSTHLTSVIKAVKVSCPLLCRVNMELL